MIIDKTQLSCIHHVMCMMNIFVVCILPVSYRIHGDLHQLGTIHDVVKKLCFRTSGRQSFLRPMPRGRRETPTHTILLDICRNYNNVAYKSNSHRWSRVILPMSSGLISNIQRLE